MNDGQNGDKEVDDSNWKTPKTNDNTLFRCSEVHFASFLSGGITTMAVINPLERKLKKRTSVWLDADFYNVCIILYIPT